MKRNIMLIIAICIMISPVVGLTVTSSSGVTAYIDQSPAPIHIILDAAPAGLSGYTMNISIAAAAEISGLSLPSWAAVWESSGTPSNEIQISAADINDNILPGATNIILATIEIRVLTEGNVTPTITFSELDDDIGSPITVSINAAIILLEGGFRPKSTQTLESLNTDGYDLLISSIGGTQQLNESDLDIDWLGLKAAAEQPYVTALGSLFYALIFALPFLMQWLRQRSMAIPGIIGIILGGAMLAKVPPEYHMVAVVFVALSVLAIIWALLKEWR